MRKNLDALKGTAAKLSAGALSLVPLAALATPSSPGGAIAAELSSGESEVMLVIAAAAAIIGVLVLWSYVKRAR